MQTLLVAFHRQHVVRPRRDHVSGNVFLTADGVDRHQRPFKIKQPQQFGDGRDLIRLDVDGLLGQADAILGREGMHQVQRLQAGATSA